MISDSIQTILEADTDTVNAVDSFTKSSTSVPMIFIGTLIPDNVSTDTGNLDIDISKKTINHYRAGSISGGSMIVNTTYSVSCRSANEYDAETIQSACYSALNRVRSSDGKYFFVASKLPVIPPADKTDNYNAPVELTVKAANCT